MEVKLWNDKRERGMFENLEELYAIIKATENRGHIFATSYRHQNETECQKLIAHFKTLSSTLKGTIPSIERFMETYRMDCPAALNRLVVSGVPATVEHRAAATALAPGLVVIVGESVRDFITAMDALKLEYKAVDELHPQLSSLMTSLDKLTVLPSDFDAKTKVREWLGRLSKMGASDELTEQQLRQLPLDLDSS